MNALKNMARLSFEFFAGCVEAGFSESQALAMTQTWLGATVAAAGGVGE
jgi:hypothetical protein